MAIAEMGRVIPGSEEIDENNARPHRGEFSVVRYTSDFHPIFWDESKIKSHLLTSEKTVNEIEDIDEKKSFKRRRQLPMGRAESFGNSFVGQLLNRISQIPQPKPSA